MLTIVHALSPFTTCPFSCPFCCAKDNPTNLNVELTNDYWVNLNLSLIQGEYQNIMLTGDTEPTLFHDWLKGIVSLADYHELVTELRTHNYKYLPTDIRFNQVWYSITEASELMNLSKLWEHGMQFADEVNFALLINKDFNATNILNARELLPQSKFTVRYLMDECGSGEIAEWVRHNRVIFDEYTEELLRDYGIRINKNYLLDYDIIRQDGKLYHQWQ